MSEHFVELPNGARIPVDEKGYLEDPAGWSPEVARTMASADGIELGADHWQVIEIFRAYFDEFGIEPPMRALVRLCSERLGEEKGDSRHLYRLFPDGPTTQACRYAGLPRPLSCV
jgi:tRNA 2-thiouridine synthesizing protein E